MISFKVTQWMADKLEEICRLEGRPMSNTVRRLLEKQLEKMEVRGE